MSMPLRAVILFARGGRRRARPVVSSSDAVAAAAATVAVVRARDPSSDKTVFKDGRLGFRAYALLGAAAAEDRNPIPVHERRDLPCARCTTTSRER